MSMTVLLNGQPKSLDNTVDVTISQFISELGFPLDRVAMERNGVILPRKAWAETFLVEGDKLELVHFVGGGAPVSRSSRLSH